MSRPTAADYVERMGFGCAQWKVLLGGGGSKVADGSELLLLSAITMAIAGEWQLDNWQKGVLVSVVFFGVLVGNMFGGVVGDRYGRRLPIILGYVFNIFFSVLSVRAWGFASITVLRFGAGVAFGVSGPAFNSLCGEMVPSRYRMHMNAWGQLAFVAGEFYSAFLVYLQDPMMNNLDWRWLTILGCVPGVVFLVLAIFVLEESPSYLAVNGRHAEAQVVLESMRSDNNALDVHIDLPQQSTSASSAQRPPSITVLESLSIVFGRHMWFTTLVVCVSIFTLNFLFYGGLYAIPQVLTDLKLHISPAGNLMLGAVSEVPGLLLAVVISQYQSRRTTMLMYLLIVCASTLAFSFAGAAIENVGIDIVQPGMESLLQCGLLGNKIFTSFGFLIVYVYAAEIYPTVARSTGGAVCIAFGRLGSIAAPTVFENLLVATGSRLAFFSCSAALCAVNALLVMFLPYETKGVVLKDFQDDQQTLAAKVPDTRQPYESAVGA